MGDRVGNARRSAEGVVGRDLALMSFRLALAALIGVALVAFLAPRADAGGAAPLTPLAAVDVVGSGPLVWRQVAVRATPSRSARAVATLEQFRPDFYPRTVLALEARLDRGGKATWYRIAVPGRPNGRSGWIPAAAADIYAVDRWLVIYRGSRKFELYVGGKLRRTGPVAVGARGMETPVGLFYVQSRFVPRKYPILGAFAFETSGYSKLSDWPGGGVVGVHGTNTPALIGQAVSHGCVRLRNGDILALRKLVRVGTPVKIVGA